MAWTELSLQPSLPVCMHLQEEVMSGVCIIPVLWGPGMSSPPRGSTLLLASVYLCPPLPLKTLGLVWGDPETNSAALGGPA